MSIIGITRVRNEALIITDTIKHYLKYCDRILLYDDCSNDDTVALATLAGGECLTVIHGDTWLKDRKMENTRHRHILTKAAQKLGAVWCLCFDADERLVGKLPLLALNAHGYRFRLFDGYLTEKRQEVPSQGDELSAVSRMWGPEYRDIIMLFRPDKAVYQGTGRREPAIKGPIFPAPTLVKHYGKCLSVDHWEETCHYYSTYFPEPFKSKWEARKGKAIHIQSDFGRELFTWESLMDNVDKWVRI